MRYDKKEAVKRFRNKLIIISDFICLNLFLKKLKEKKGIFLDAGCGEGFLTRQVTGFKKVIGLDTSKEMIALAKTNNKKIEYYVSDIRKMAFLKNKEIDVITSVSVLHYLKNKIEIETALKEFFRVLKPKGKLFLSVVHPCFNTSPGKITKNYFSHQFYPGKLNGTDGRKLKVGAYQHMISDYVNGLLKAGFKLKEMIEPKVSSRLIKKYPSIFKRNKKLPQFLILIAGK